MRAIARDEGQRAAQVERAEHYNECGRTGHACDLWKAINDIRSEQKAMATQHAEERGQLEGAMKAQTRFLALVVGSATVIGVLANIVSAIWKARHGG